MIFQDKLKAIRDEVVPEFDSLFQSILENQVHQGDALLIVENGFYYPDVYSWTNFDEKFSPYMVGPSSEGHSFNTHYDFIHNYRTKSISKISLGEYLDLVKYDSDRVNEIRRYEAIEGQMIQVEMLVFLKIWENDSFIKKYYELVLLANAEPYDWHFRIPESARDHAPSTGKRHDIIRKKIRDRLRNNFPTISAGFTKAYNTQIRNAIAHSKYSILGRNIRLYNYVKNDPASQLEGITFDDWIARFHWTMIIYNELIRMVNRLRDYYRQLAQENHGLVKVKVPPEQNEGSSEYRYLEYKAFDQESGRWGWKRD